MRIVITSLQHYPDAPSGAARLAYDEAVFLAARGHEVWVITQDVERRQPVFCLQDGLRLLRYPSPRLASFDPRRIRAHQRRTRDLLSRFIGQPVDLLHGHSLLNYAGAVSLYGDKTRRCYSVHSPVRLECLAGARGAPWPDRLRLSIMANLTHRIERRCLERSDVVTVESSYARSLLQDLHGGRPLPEIHVLPGWVDLSRYYIARDRQALKSQLGWPTGVPVFFTLRRFVPRMGLDILLRSLRAVAAAGCDFHLMMGGSGPQRESLERLTAELGLTARVSFLGGPADDVLPKMYAAADAFLLPTAELECFGLIALEALASGRPVLATPVGAIPEIVGEIEPRWLAGDPGPEAVAELVLNFLKTRLPVHEPAELRDQVARKYSKDAVLERLVRLAMGELPPGSVPEMIEKTRRNESGR